MNHLLFRIFGFLLFGIVIYSFNLKSEYDFAPRAEGYFAIDTIDISNRQIGTGSKIFTDQDALVILPPPGARLYSIELYFTNVSTLVSDSSRLFVKSQRSWSCSPLGNAHPFQIDSYTLGLTKNVAVQTGWNRYLFDEPIELTNDTIYIWPDLIQQIQPRVPYALGNHNAIANLTNFACATPGSDISVLDFACALTFITFPPCPPFLIVTDSDSTCYVADTLVARTLIDSGRCITYLSKSVVSLDTSFVVDQTARLTVDMSGCQN